MKPLSVLCLMLCLIRTPSLAAKLPLTPPILDRIQTEIQDYQARFDRKMTP